MNIGKSCPLPLCNSRGECPGLFVYCFSCRYLVGLGLRQLGLPVSKGKQPWERKGRWPWPRFPQERLLAHMVMVLCKFVSGKRKTMTMTKISSKKTCYTYGHGPLINLFQSRNAREWLPGGHGWRLHSLVAGVGSLFMACYIGVTSTVLEPFQCQGHPNSRCHPTQITPPY